MDGFDKEVLTRLPLADAVLRVLSFVLDTSHLEELFDRFRGRCYDKLISFSLLVGLIADALLQHGGSGRKSFQRAAEQGRMPASATAAYGKLRRLPLALSMAFLAACTARLAELLQPRTPVYRLPDCLQGLRVVIIDGKAIKQVAKRLKLTQGIEGGLLGGKALVAMTLDNGLAVAFNADLDGETNDAALVEGLLPEVAARVEGPKLWVCDRQFCDLTQPRRFLEQGDRFLIRYHPKVSFHPDPDRPARLGQDRQGRRYREEWGWLGQDPKRRLYVRRITLYRPGDEAVILVTDLLDADAYPAVELLDLYLARWGIEGMFQQVTEVFQLQRLIGSSPQASIFQFAFCLLLYNIIQVVRAYVADANGQAAATISTENLFYDAKQELIAANKVLQPAALVSAYGTPMRLEELRQYLRHRLQGVWSKRWLKAPKRKYQPHPATSRVKGGHTSVQRILTDKTGKYHKKVPDH